MNAMLGVYAPFITDPSRPGFSPRLPPQSPRTVGEHLKRARLDRSIAHRDAARVLGCDPGALLTFQLEEGPCRARSRHPRRLGARHDKPGILADLVGLRALLALGRSLVGQPSSKNVIGFPYTVANS